MRRSNPVLLAAALLCTMAPLASAQLVTNGGFETCNFSGWTQFGNTGFTSVDGGAHSGSCGGSFGPVGSTGGILQSLTTTASAGYTLSFWLTNSSGTPNSFDAFWEGTSLSPITNAPGFGYTQYVFNVNAGLSGSSELRFQFQQDPSFWHLDDVSVVETAGVSVAPEPSSLLLLASGLSALVLGTGLAARTRARRIQGAALNS